MPIRKTSKNRVALPKRVIAPVTPSRADKVREKLARRGITERDVKSAIRWARKSS